MKRISALLMTIAFLLAMVFSNVFVVNAALVPGTNILTNPGFENGGTGWVWYDPAGYSSIWPWETHSGSSCLRLAPNSWTNAQQTVNLLKDTQYYFSAYVKANDANATGGYIWLNGSGFYINSTPFSVSMNEGWKKIEYYFTWPYDNATQSLIIQPMTGSGWVMLVDDVVLAPMIEDTVAVSGVLLNKTSLALPLGTSETLTATISPDNASNKTIIWTTSDETVATVTSEGFVEAKAVGSATIKATSSSNSSVFSECAVTVTQRVLGQNLLTNYGFEDDFLNWNKLYENGGVSNANYYRGTKSYLFSSTLAYTGLINQTAKSGLIKDNFYYFSAYVKADTANINGQVILQYSLDGVNSIYKQIATISATLEAGWVKVEGIYKHTDNSVSSSIVHLRPNYFTTDKAYVDDIVFAQIMPSTFIPVSFNSFNEPLSYVLTGLTEEMNDSQFLAEVNNSNGQTLKLFNKEKVELQAGATVGTGTILEVDHNGYKVEYKIVIYGDINGDGSIGVTDLALMKQQLLKTTNLSDIYKNAADVNKNSTVSISDLIAVKKDILGIASIVQ